VTGTLVVNSPLNVNLATPGQEEMLSFTATAGQSFALQVSGISTVPANSGVIIDVLNPNGSPLTRVNLTSTGTTINLTNLAAGTYQVLLDPYYASTATMTVELVP
ncbi:MAG: pre-peptidase C-terminal domain-containing protein, partial [Gammaproteobacteria bacterium]